MNSKTFLTSITYAAGICSLAASIFLFQEARYAAKMEIERVKAVILKKDLQSQKNVEELWLDINAKARDYWMRKEKAGEELTGVDRERLDYLNEQVPKRQERVEELQEEIIEIEREIELE